MKGRDYQLSYLVRIILTHLRSKATKKFAGIIAYAALVFTASAQTIPLTEFGDAGQGNDDTDIIQYAINITAANLETLEIPAAAQAYNVWPLTIPNNANIILDPGVVIQAMSGYVEDQQMIHIEYVSNVSITGTPGQSVFQMRKSEYTSGEFRHCMRIAGSRNVALNGISCNNSGGDGLYIGANSNNISVFHSTFNNNRRQGLTITSANGVTVSDCAFTNTNGTGPADGIDLEPNTASDQLQNILIQNSSISGNAGNGLTISLNPLTYSSNPVSITINQVTSSNNGGNGFAVWNEHDNGVSAAGGNILIENSTSTNDANYGAAAIFYDATGAVTTFQNLTITNANTSRTNVDGAAIAVKRGGGASRPMGNVKFIGTSISDPNHKLQNYFTVEDYSKIGVSNIYIGSFGTLSGLSSTLGILNGRTVTSVDIR